MYDVFISFKDDENGKANENGKAIARELTRYLEKMNYSVYFNADQREAGAFPERLRNAIMNCKDVVIIMTNECKEKLLKNEPEDWIHYELQLAHEERKNIIGLLIDDTEWPTSKLAWPKDIDFLHDLDYINCPGDFERVTSSPADIVVAQLKSLPERGDNFRDVYNSNLCYNVVEDFQRAKQEAQNGSLDAIYELALMYYYGYADDLGGSTQDYYTAYQCFKKLAATENEYTAFAINMIGHMYYNGTIPGEEQSYEESLKRHLFVAHEIGSAAQHAAYMLSIGSGCDFDYEEVVKFYEEIEKSGDSVAKFNLANFYCKYGEYVKAEKLYQTIYSTNYNAAIQLGKLYQRGVLANPPKPDYREAVYYFQYAIDFAGEDCGPEPYYELGKIYFNPTGKLNKNFKLAEEKLKVAADMGHADAQYLLGYIYAMGHVGRDIGKAIHYYELAVKQGSMESAANLAILYQQPGYVNYHRAFNYARLSAENGISMGEFLYATLLFLGRGCKADMDKAYKYFKRSFEHGFMQAKFMMDKVKKYL